MRSCEEARYHLTQCGNARLDGDGDGTPCEALCR
ncbi:excalibur calcium-binding domain-containing protein [Salinicola sp. DM10]|nr:excalibur calcium-binding domain-containing protein [Salinicola sp. DM10]